MTTRLRLVSGAALLGMSIPMFAATALAQGSPAFEVASVRPSPDTPPGPGMAGVQISKQQARFAYLSLRDYIGIAFKVPIHQISGPDWINSARFDIAATLPAGSADEDFPLMVEELLRSRFRLQAHRESRESPVYVLEVGRKGSTLVAIPDDTPKDAPFTVTSTGGPDGVSVELGHGASLVMNNTRIDFRKVTMQALVDTLGRFLDRPVIDRTKLEGRYDVAFAIAPEDYMPLLIRSAVNAGIQLPAQALQLLDAPSRGSVEAGLASLGLSLERQRAPLPYVVVDSMERTPTEN